jgi:hypothetical protein
MYIPRLSCCYSFSSSFNLERRRGGGEEEGKTARGAILRRCQKKMLRFCFIYSFNIASSNFKQDKK